MAWCRLVDAAKQQAARQQAITWANGDPDLCRHMASLGHNVLNSVLPSDAIWDCKTWLSLYPPPNKVYWIHLVRPSVCPSVRLSVDDMVSGA